MKKIAVGTVNSFLKEHSAEHEITKSFEVGKTTFDVRIRTKLSTAEKSVFINRVLSGCFDQTNRFRPEYFTPMLRATILQMCTNVPVLSLKGESQALDLDGMNDLYVALDLDRMGNGEYTGLCQELIQLCSMAIEWKKSCVLAGEDSASKEALFALADMAHTIRNGVAALSNLDANELMKYAGQLSEATKGLEEGGILKGLLDAHEKKESS